jgi:hypothetical protein
MKRRKQSTKLSTATMPVTIRTVRPKTRYELDTERQARHARAKLQITLLLVFMAALVAAEALGLRP